MKKKKKTFVGLKTNAQATTRREKHYRLDLGVISVLTALASNYKPR